MKKSAALFLLTLLSVLGIPPSLADEHTAEKAVLITGASTGIGRMAAERLAKAGYFVYAGARKQSDIDALNAIENIKAVKLDVTVQKEIDAAVELIRNEGRGLWGLVNNAGVNVIEPLIEGEESTLEFIFDVNVYGVFRVTKAFAPMIIESKGRIVNISSIAGVLSGGLTGYGFYMMSKHAIEAYTDQLAWEMAKFDVAVSAIEPGSFETSIGETRCKRMLAQRGDRNYQHYAEEMNAYYERCGEAPEQDAPSTAPLPVPVAAAIEHALFNDKPKEHYLVVSELIEAQITIGKLLEELVHLNANHEFSYERDEILEILDAEEEVLRGERPRGMPGAH